MQFLEAKFTEHSLSQSTNSFSVMKDGEQKATQTYMWLFRTLSKYFAVVKLPLHFFACKLGIISFPELAYHQVSKFTELRKKQAEETRDKQSPGKVIGLEKASELKPI